MPEIPYGGVKGNDATDDHLWKHGLVFVDAVAVWHGPAKYFSQEEAVEHADFGQVRLRPTRTMMIGPDRSGRMLTFILDFPDDSGEAHVVTGWLSTRGERSRYHRPGGRMRR